MYKGGDGWRKWCDHVIESAVLPVEHLSLVFDYASLHCAIRHEWEYMIDGWCQANTASNLFNSDTDESSEEENICIVMRNCIWCNPRYHSMLALLDLCGFNATVCIDHQLRQMGRFEKEERQLVRMVAPQLFNCCKDDLDEASLLLGFFHWGEQIDILIALCEVESASKRLAVLVKRIFEYCASELPEMTDSADLKSEIAMLICHSRYGDAIRDGLVFKLPVEYVKENANWLRCNVLEDEDGEVEIVPYEIDRSFLLFSDF